MVDLAIGVPGRKIYLPGLENTFCCLAITDETTTALADGKSRPQGRKI
jgi:hypothetical protein